MSPSCPPPAGSHPREELSESLLLDFDGVRVGALHCAPTHPQFEDLGAVSNHVVAFPTAPIGLRRESGASYMGTPGIATILNRGEHLLREARVPDGDRCEWIGLDADVAAGLAREVDPRSADRASRPFRDPFALVPSATYLRMRRLTAALRRGTLEAATAVESAVEIVGEALEAAALLHRADPRGGRRTRERTLVEEARSALARDLGEPLRLRDVATLLGVTPYWLCRAFRRATGHTPLAYRRQLRLLASLERAEDPRCDLATLAFEFGFASHSHYTHAFRREFGLAPSTWRGRARVIGRPAFRA